MWAQKLPLYFMSIYFEKDIVNFEKNIDGVGWTKLILNPSRSSDLVTFPVSPYHWETLFVN